jgi:hypothetical protein
MVPGKKKNELEVLPKEHRKSLAEALQSVTLTGPLKRIAADILKSDVAEISSFGQLMKLYRAKLACDVLLGHDRDYGRALSLINDTLKGMERVVVEYERREKAPKLERAFQMLLDTLEQKMPPEELETLKREIQRAFGGS